MLLVLAAFVLASSCTNEKYALTEENIDTQVQVFSDGLTLPLGSIDKIQLKDLLGQVGESEAGNFLAAMEDGTYAINLSDSYDLSESLNEMLEDLKIDAVKYEDKFSFNLGAVDVSSVTIDAMTFPEEPYEVLFSEVIGDVELDPVSIELTPDPIEVEISKYMPESLDLDFELEPLSSPVLKVGDNIQLSESLLNDVEVSLDMFSSYISMPAFNVEESIPVEISLPKGVKEVGSVILDKDAAISVKVALENPFVKAGEIVPEVELDLSGIFAVKDTEGGVIDLSVMKLTGENGFSAEAVYPITSIILDEDNWAVSKDGKYEYKADVPVSAAGQLETKNLTTTTKLLYNNRSTNLKVALEFVDLGIADVKMNVDPLEVTAAEVVEVEFSAELPEQVGGIGHVAFDKTSAITVTLKPSNLDKFKDLDVTLDNLTLTFPKGMVVKDAVEGVISKTDVDLKSGYELKVQVEKFELPDLDKNNTLAYTGQIKVDVEASVGGWVNTASLPAKPEDDIKFEVSVDGELAIEDYNVALKQVSYELDPMKEEICIDVPADIKDLGSVVIYPECSDDTAAVPAITLDFVLPDVDLPIRPADGGLCISLPQMLRFSDLPASYNYDAKSHSVCFKDELPSKIVLPVEKIVITPEADGDKYVVKGAISVEGGITLDACEITKDVSA